jgi:hypothetical protein
LIRVMVGHLLLLSSARESAWNGPSGSALILRGLEQGKADRAVAAGTLCGPRDTESTG